MMKKKIFRMTAVLLLICVFAGCRNTDVPATSGNGETTTQTETMPPTTELSSTLNTTEGNTTIVTTVTGTQSGTVETTDRGETEVPTTEAPTTPPTSVVTQPSENTDPVETSEPEETEATVPTTTVPVTTVPATEVPVTTVPTTEAPATTAPTTEATVPTTAEPTTVPTTEAPTTAPSTGAPTEPSVPATTASVETTVPVTTAPPATTVPPTEHTHNYSKRVVAPDCTHGGYTQFSCACGHSYKGEETKPLGHIWGEWEPYRETTVFREGEEIRFCTACQCADTRVIAKLTKEESEKQVAELFLQYINQFRLEEGSTELTYLPGMTQVAQYRSKQLVTNFAHDEGDIREANAHYKYGKYYDMTQYGYDESYSYYYDDGNEAIGMDPGKGTPDQIALKLATAFRNSDGHWRYLKSSEYSFAGVGVTFADGKHYICIKVGRVNYG